MTIDRPIDPERFRVYVVTSSAFRGRWHTEIAEAAIVGGATALQLRAPEVGAEPLRVIASDLRARTRGTGIAFIVNDRADVAVAVDADGPHVGQGDSATAARSELGPGRILGISVPDVAQARRATSLGADYLGVTVWLTPTKPEAGSAGLEGLRQIAESTPLPVVGIGGIDASNAGDVIRAGAAGVAVISAVAGADDPVAATRDLRAAVRAALDERGGSR
jgi:thiamine-phosphate pyrophosphorylase